MKIKLLLIGKTDSDYLKKGVDEYLKRIKRYLPFEMLIIPDIKKTKNLSEDQQKQKEAELILNQLNPGDFIILLDEKGKEYCSVGFSEFIEKQMISGMKNMVFIVGGPYGFSNEIYKLGNLKISLSKMTFSHQMVRLIFTEQLYRALTIIKGEPYHHK